MNVPQNQSITPKPLNNFDRYPLHKYLNNYNLHSIFMLQIQIIAKYTQKQMKMKQNHSDYIYIRTPAYQLMY